MRGKVITYNDVDARGLISGDDGRRYAFVRGALGSGLRAAHPGQDVDFEVAGTDAINIYVLGNGGQVGRKSKIAAGLFAIFLGGLGVHKFYLGYVGAGVVMLLLWLFGWILIGIPTLIVSVIALIEGIIYLTKSDGDFYETYEKGRKAWL